MANQIKLDAVTDLPPHVDGKPSPAVIDKGHSHDVHGIAKHLRQFDTVGELMELANPEHDTEAHFTKRAAQAHDGAEIAKEK
jgi:hypothetical protein